MNKKPTYSDSEGNRWTTEQIDRKIREAKQLKLNEQEFVFGYNFCEICLRNDCKPLDCSHEISVKEAKESGRAELCWSLDNIKIRGRKCHQKHDKLNLQFNDNFNKNRG